MSRVTGKHISFRIELVDPYEWRVTGWEEYPIWARFGEVFGGADRKTLYAKKQNYRSSTLRFLGWLDGVI